MKQLIHPILPIAAAIILALLILHPAHGAGGCLPQSVITNADAAGQALRYGWPGADASINQATSAARAARVPSHHMHRLRLASIYHRRGLDKLAQRHLFWVVRHGCW